MAGRAETREQQQATGQLALKDIVYKIYFQIFRVHQTEITHYSDTSYYMQCSS